MKKAIFILCAWLSLSTTYTLAAGPFGTAIEDSTERRRLRISVLTCAPGDELYSLFGHTAIRIIDSLRGTDVVYNYGTFDFNDPDFYTKFIKGKLDYFLSAESLPDFLYEYQLTKRAVVEQELALAAKEQQAIADAITYNLQGANRYYKYDFLYDNCTSRVRALLTRYAGLDLSKTLIPAGTSFRDMLHEYLDRGGMAWTKLGIDILLAVPADRKPDIAASMFLPDYLMKGIDSAVNTRHPVLAKKIALLDLPETKRERSHFPLYLVSAIAAILLLLPLVNTSLTRRLTLFTDRLVLFLSGSIGLLLLFLWFGTDHTALKVNYNLLWALPLNIIPAFMPTWNASWIKKYFKITALLYAIVLVAWFWLPQQLNITLIPVVLLLLFTAARRSRNYH